MNSAVEITMIRAMLMETSIMWDEIVKAKRNLSNVAMVLASSKKQCTAFFRKELF
jgi:hypothetical protein